jgi:hypothetical protein
VELRAHTKGDQMAPDQSLNSISQPAPEDASRPGGSIARRVLGGAFLGLAWGASLRAWMVPLALDMGDTPRLTWSGTFGGVLLPTMLVGALLGAAAHDAESSDSKRWRWGILSPLLLIAGPVIFTKDFFTTLIKTGMGGGAIGVALIGMFGGYAFSGFGRRWTRRVSGLLAAVLAIASVFPVYFANRESAVPSISKVFGVLQFALLMVLLVIGVSAPSRKARR